MKLILDENTCCLLEVGRGLEFRSERLGDGRTLIRAAEMLRQEGETLSE